MLLLFTAKQLVGLMFMYICLCLFSAVSYLRLISFWNRLVHDSSVFSGSLSHSLEPLSTCSSLTRTISFACFRVLFWHLFLKLCRISFSFPFKRSPPYARNL